MYTKLDIDNYPTVKQFIKYLIGHNGFICGGAFKNIFNKENVKDLDIFFLNITDFNTAVKYYINAGDKYQHLYSSNNAEGFMEKETKIKIDLVKTIFGTPEEIVEQFDFTIAKAYYQCEAIHIDQDEWEYKHHLYVHENFFEHLHMKRLVIDNQLLLPINTFERVLRYVKYGYTPCRETKVRLMVGIANEVLLNRDNNVDVSDILSNSLYGGID